MIIIININYHDNDDNIIVMMLWSCDDRNARKGSAKSQRIIYSSKILFFVLNRENCSSWKKCKKCNRMPKLVLKKNKLLSSITNCNARTRKIRDRIVLKIFVKST